MVSNTGNSFIEFHERLTERLSSEDPDSEATLFQKAYTMGFAAGAELESLEQELLARMREAGTK